MDTLILLQIIKSFLAIITISVFTLVLTFRNYYEYKRTKEWNWSRLLITHSIFMKIVDHVIRLFYYIFQINLFGWSYSESIETISTTTIFTGLMVMFGLMFAAFINEWDFLLYMPVFFYSEALILFTVIQYAIPIHFFIIGGGIMTLCAIWDVAIRTKDPIIIRLSIIYTIIFVNTFGSAMTQAITGLIGYPIGIFIIFKYFNPISESKNNQTGDKLHDTA